MEMIRGVNDTHVGTGWVDKHVEVLVTYFGKYSSIFLGG
jgi:hypothetical protein